DRLKSRPQDKKSEPTQSSNLLAAPVDDTEKNPQLNDLQQSMDELLRHLKQPSMVNFQKMLEKGLNQPFGIPVKISSPHDKEEEGNDPDVDSTPSKDVTPFIISEFQFTHFHNNKKASKGKKIGDLRKEIEQVKKQLAAMENTHQTLEANLKYKDGIIEEQKRTLQNEKNFRSTVQEWKSDLLKEIATLIKPGQIHHRQSSWGETITKKKKKKEKLIQQSSQRYQSQQPSGQESVNNTTVSTGNTLVTNEMQQLMQLSTKLTQDMGAVGMLSTLREEYKIIRDERDALKKTVDQFRKHNTELLTKINQLEQEVLYLRESKRTTVKNMVDEMNEMREKIASLSHITKIQELPSK
ncbi:translocated promoter region (to activated MET oncogene) isoform 2, partial [Reticulomyxa filosa]